MKLDELRDTLRRAPELERAEESCARTCTTCGRTGPDDGFWYRLGSAPLCRACATNTPKHELRVIEKMLRTEFCAVCNTVYAAYADDEEHVCPTCIIRSNEEMLGKESDE